MATMKDVARFQIYHVLNSCGTFRAILALPPTHSCLKTRARTPLYQNRTINHNTRASSMAVDNSHIKLS